LEEQSDWAELLVDQNEYFKGMTEIEFKCDGTVSKIVRESINRVAGLKRQNDHLSALVFMHESAVKR
jgi:hypothetical protein